MPLEAEVKALERRVNKLENLAWVIGTVAAILGFSVVSLFNRISKEQTSHEIRMGEIKKLADDRERYLTLHGGRVEKQLNTTADSARNTILADLEREGARIRGSLLDMAGRIPGWDVAYCVLTRGQARQS
jgi:hypothetical protein